jgi:hypothetical protein
MILLGKNPDYHAGDGHDTGHSRRHHRGEDRNNLAGITGSISTRGVVAWHEGIRIVVKQITTNPAMANAESGCFS